METIKLKTTPTNTILGKPYPKIVRHKKTGQFAMLNCLKVNHGHGFIIGGSSGRTQGQSCIWRLESFEDYNDEITLQNH